MNYLLKKYIQAMAPSLFTCHSFLCRKLSNFPSMVTRGGKKKGWCCSIDVGTSEKLRILVASIHRKPRWEFGHNTNAYNPNSDNSNERACLSFDQHLLKYHNVPNTQHQYVISIISLYDCTF